MLYILCATPEQANYLASWPVPLWRQLRFKNLSEAALQDALATVHPAPQHTTILNDTPQWVNTYHFDGVHIGRDDGAIASARKCIGHQKILGVSCYDSLETARNAIANGADYVAFGSVFASPTKPAAVACPLAIIRSWHAQSAIPCAAIGGITVDNAVQVVQAGADYLAISSGVWHHPRGWQYALNELQHHYENKRQ